MNSSGSVVTSALGLLLTALLGGKPEVDSTLECSWSTLRLAHSNGWERVINDEPKFTLVIKALKSLETQSQELRVDSDLSKGVRNVPR